jgi:hypothetical protein
VSTISLEPAPAGDRTASFDSAVGTALQQQTARLREFYPQVLLAEDDTYRRLLDRLAS